MVALDRDEYITKMENNLADANTYTLLQHNPVNKLICDFKKILKRWHQYEYISSSIYSQLNTINVILSTAYGLPKIHNIRILLRIIVSFTGSPLYNLVTFLQEILRKSLLFLFSHTINNFELTKELPNIHIPADQSGFFGCDFLIHQCLYRLSY